MKFHLLLCFSLMLLNQVFARNIEIAKNVKNTFNFTESRAMTNMESTLTMTSNWNENTATTMSTQPKCPKNMQHLPWKFVQVDLKCYCEYPFEPIPLNGTCYELFRQGPCESKNFLIRSPFKGLKFVLPRCTANPCLEDGLVPYNKTCQNITTTQQLCNNNLLYYKETTSEIVCMHSKTSLSGIAPPTRSPCPPGSRQDRNGECRRKL